MTLCRDAKQSRFLQYLNEEPLCCTVSWVILKSACSIAAAESVDTVATARVDPRKHECTGQTEACVQ
jgi:histidinol phosphatase-like enzyme